MKKNQSNKFTLVELLLAMGVIVIGICSIMALFPLSATNATNASMKYYANSVGPQFLGWYKFKLLANAQKDGWGVTSYFTTMTQGRPAADVSFEYYDASANLDNATWDYDNTKDFFGNNVLGQDEVRKNCYLLKYSTVINKGTPEEETVTDFRALLVVWYEPVRGNQMGKKDTWSTIEDVDGDGTLNHSDPDKEYNPGALGLCVKAEISWPIEVPYEDRHKLVYSQEVYNLKYDMEEHD